MSSVARLLIWTDAHLSPALAPWLRTSFGVEAIPLRDLGLREAEDPVIFEAARDVGAVLMTKDRDFADLVMRHGPPPQIVWLTAGNTSNARLREILHLGWHRIVEMLASGEPLVEIGGREP